MALTADILDKDGKKVLDATGRIDSATCGAFEEKLIGIIDDEVTSMIVDLSKIEFISSAGLRVLLLAAKKVKPYGGKVVLCGLSAEVKEVFDISGFTGLFDIHNTLEEALGSY